MSDSIESAFRDKTLDFVNEMEQVMDAPPSSLASSEQRLAIYRSMNQMLTAALRLPGRQAKPAAPANGTAPTPAPAPAGAVSDSDSESDSETEEAAASGAASGAPRTTAEMKAAAKAASKKVPKISLRDYGYAMAEGAGKRKEALNQAIREHSAGIVLERLMDLQDLWADNRKPLYLAAIREDIQHVSSQL